MQAKEKLLLAKEEIKSIALSTRDLINSENENSNASSSQSSNPIFVTNATATQRMKDLQQDLKSAQEQLLLTKDGILDIKSFVRNLTDLAYENANLSTGVLDDTFDRTTTMSALNLTEWQGQLIQSQNQLLLTADDIENIAKYAEDIIELGIKAINTSLGQTSHSVLGPNASAMEILQEWQRKFKAVEQQALLAEDEVKNIADFTSNTFSHILTPPNGTITEYFDKNASTIEILKAVHRELAAAALCHTATGPNASSIDLLQHWQTKFNEMQQQALLAKDEMKNISDYTTNTFSDILGLPNGTSTEPLDKNMSTIDILKAVHRELSEAALCEKQMKEVFDVIKIEYQNITLPRGDGNHSITEGNATALQMLQELKRESTLNKEQLLLAQDEIEEITNFAKDLVALGTHNLDAYSLQANETPLEHSPATIETLNDLQRKLKRTQELLLLTNDEIKTLRNFPEMEEVNDTNPVLETTPIQILQDWQETLMQAKEKLLLAKEEIKSIALSTRDLINSENENSNASSSQSSNPIFVTNATATQRMKDLQQDLKSAQEQLLLTKDGILDIKSFVRNLTDLAYENANLSTGVLDDTFDRTTTMSALNLTEWQGQLIQSQNQLLLTADDIENIAKYAEDIIELVLGPNASAMEILQEWQRKFKAVEQQALLAEDEVKNIADFTSNTFSHILTPPNGTITEYFDKNASTIEILKAVHRELAAAALCHTATGPNASSIDLLQHWQTKFNEMQQQALLAKDEMKNISDYTTNTFSDILGLPNGTSTEPLDKNMSTIDILKAVHQYQNITLPRGDGNHSITEGNATALQMLQELKRESTLNKEQLLLAQDEIEEITNFAKDLVALGTHNLDAYSLQANETPLEHSPATIETLNDLQRKLKRTQELLLLTNDEIKTLRNFPEMEEVNDTNPVLETTPIQILQDWQETLMQAKEKLLLAKEEIKSIALSTRDLINSENENSNASSSQSSNPIFVTNATATQRMKDLQQDLKSAQEQLLLTKDGILDIKSFVRNLTDLAYENANLSTGVLDDTFDRTTTMSALNLTEWQGQLIQSQNQLLLTADDIENIAKYAEDIIELGIKAINTSLGQTSHSVLGPNASAMEILQEWQRKFKAVEQQALLAEDEVKNIADFTSNTFSHILTPPNGTITEYFDKNASTIEILKAVHRELAAAALCHTATGPNASSIDLIQHWQTKFNEMQQQALLAKDEMKNISDYTTNTFSDILGLPNGTSTEPLDKNMSTIDILKAVHRELSEAALCEKQMKEVFDVIKIEYQNITLPRGDGNHSITVGNATALQMLQELKRESTLNKEQLLLAQDEIEEITNFAKDLVALGTHNLDAYSLQANETPLEHSPATIETLNDLQRKLKRTQELLLLTNDEIKNITEFSRVNR
ncbi:hypothetical protein OUZ56_029056 [Daphnia magna]|uniref:Uncharacterized protein n=1 Tax=Daphnia magna TaxID=35525 RepID=A0ABR0B5Q3_9CRUS|nr:hypothetical protein OUZ56_029056 [Daphnia magna]